MRQLSLIVIIVAVLGAAVLTQPTPVPLFGAVGSTVSPQGMRGVVRARVTSLDLNLIGGRDGSVVPAERLHLNLFPGDDLTATLDQFETTDSGGSWSGTIDGSGFGSVLLVSVNGVVSGRASAFGRVYTIRGPRERVTVSEIDEQLLPQRDDAVPAPAPDTGTFTPQASADDGSAIDIGVFYSEDAKRAAGGTDAIRADIRVAVTTTNTAFAWSDVDTRLNLKSTGKYTGGDSGDMGRDLRGMTFYSPSFDRFRNRERLDLIALITENDDSYCGIAWVNGLNARGRYGYSITARDCLLGHTFAHEIGHNIGAMHDWYVSDRAGAYTFSHGHVDPDLKFRTIMSYGSLCWDIGTDCPSIQWFSNPRINVLATSRFVGVPRGTDTRCSKGKTHHYWCDADSARTFSTMRRVVARFR